MEIVRPWIPGTSLIDNLSKIKESAIDAAKDANLPGHIDGPSDAIRHIIGAAEVVRNTAS